MPARRKYTGASLAEAVNRVRLGELSQRQASAQYGIPRATIFDKISGRRPPEMCAMGPSPYLTMAEEAKIATWAIQMSRIGYGRTKPQILQMAQRIIRDDGRPNPFKDDKPGKNWFSRFMTRNPTLSLRTPQALGQERAVLTPQKIDKWFEGLHQYMVEKNAVSILSCPDRIWNADESGFALSPTGDRVIGMRGAKFVYSFSSTTKTNLSTLEAASASGIFCPPFVIYPGKRVSRNWKPMEGAPESWLYGFSESGWMNSELFYSWLANHFHPFLLSRGTHFPVLLLVDGHASHVDLHVAEFCQHNNIILYRLQAHASHIIQPLDLSVFGPLKKAYKKREGEWKDAHPGQFVTKAFFAGVFANAWADIKPELATAGFRAAGIYPFTRGYCRDKLAPSQVFTTPPATPPAAPALPPAAPAPPPAAPAPPPAAPAPPPAAPAPPPAAPAPPPAAPAPPPAAPAPPPAAPAPPPAAPVIPAPPPAQEEPSTSTAMPIRPSTAYQYRPPTYVSPAFDKYLKFPEAVRSAPKRKTGDELPNAISGLDWIRYQTKRRSDKEAEEERKKKKREEREAKKAEKEKEKLEKKKKGGKRSRKVQLREEEVDEMVCSECQDDFDDEDSNNCVGCNYCPRWFHVECTELIGLNIEEVEATDFKCGVCDEE
ncbi:uncharacterized protein LOC115929451 [Strongylocentrotus purpuratus]|uniref:Uncharacterized protein n=1 Tax=Strongylocentrotus purpuratus TaxID=7668 RepID=A0A7M7PNW2_STRPU|nr:uncharacterized protein LOC115929451 [Strongylocentrotus purpuratus]